MLVATGVTDGELLEGVSYVRGSAYTQSIIISSLTDTIRKVDGIHNMQSFASLSNSHVNGLTTSNLLKEHVIS